MGNQPQSQRTQKAAGFTSYASKRIIIAIVSIVAVVWGFSTLAASIGREKAHEEEALAQERLAELKESLEQPASAPASKESPGREQDKGRENADAEPLPSTARPDDPGKSDDTPEKAPSEEADRPAPASETAPEAPPKPEPPPAQQDREAPKADLPIGVVFANAAIAPLHHELNKRFYRWRPNDIVNVTDNVNNFQLGVLEVTRRTVVLLAERISRTGTTAAFNPHLENAMNWLMVKADRYWFPSPESKYKESLKELAAFRNALINRRASFYTRTDNLIPLLSSYENLLGSCDENLVKQKNKDGSSISLFKADDYFYYAKGVANSMATVLEAVQHDFKKTLESRHATELLHHAIESCHQAAALSPLLITDGDLDGIFANHRANMAAPISHARFYIGQLVKTLST